MSVEHIPASRLNRAYWIEQHSNGGWVIGDSVGVIYRRPTRKEVLESVGIYECEHCKGTGRVQPNKPAPRKDA